MKKTIFAILAAASLCSCANNGYTLTGKLELQQGDSVYIFSLDDTVLASSVVDAEGRFTLKGEVEVPTLAAFATADQETIGYIFLEKGEMTLQYDGEMAAATGTPANDAYVAYGEMMEQLQAEFMAAESIEAQVALRDRADSMTRAQVDANKENLFSAYLVATQYAGLPVAELREIVAAMSPEVQASNVVARINEAIEIKAATEVGQPFIELNLPNTEGDAVALSSLIGEGKWVLVDFWATWCGPCKQEIPHLVEAYKELHDKGFEIYGVSLDHDAAAWEAFLPANEMNWVNVLGADSEQIEKYGVRSIPSNYLISPEGKIVASQLRGEEVIKILRSFIQ